MDGFLSLVPLRRRGSSRTALLLGIALLMLCFGIGCGDFCLFCDDDEDGSQDVCADDPCADITNAVPDSCSALGEGEFTCSCDSGYFWEGEDEECVDPCVNEPCGSIANAVEDSCKGVSVDDYTCDCESGFEWEGGSNVCEEVPFQLTSSVFSDGGQIPSKYAATECNGDNLSPPLAWSNTPEETQSFALFMVDSDADSDFVHWVVLNIPATFSEIGEGMVPQGATQLINDFGDLGYGGPCPPQEEEHEYAFSIIALSVEEIDATSYEDALADAEDAAIATASLVGLYSQIPDPCEGDPCGDLDHATAGTCVAGGSDDFTCGCESGYAWDPETNQCEEVSAAACDELESCLLECTGFDDSTCVDNCNSTQTDCDCELNLVVLVSACAGECPFCLDSQDKECWDCAVPCGFDSLCQ